MKKASLLPLVFGAMATLALAHDPRTVAKDFSHGLQVEGAGALNIGYKALHFNETVYKRIQSDAELRNRMNAGVWSNIGAVDAGFDVVIGTQPMKKGRYILGVNFGENESFSLVLKGPDTVRIPLETTSGNPDVPFLTFALYPTDAPDAFVLEGRCGKFRSWAAVKVPYLAEHAHPSAPKK